MTDTTKRQGHSIRGRPKSLSPEIREAAILEAAERLMAEQGLHAASMAAIASAAGMSKRTIYEIFDSRQALFEACIRRIRTSFVRPLSTRDRSLPLSQRLQRLLSPVRRQDEWEIPLAVLRAVVFETFRNPEIGRTFLEEGPQQARHLISKELQVAVEHGEIQLDDVDLAAQMLCDMAYENPIERLLAPDLPAPTPTEMDARLSLAIHLFIKGAAPTPGMD